MLLDDGAFALNAAVDETLGEDASEGDKEELTVILRQYVSPRSDAEALIDSDERTRLKEVPGRMRRRIGAWRMRRWCLTLGCRV